jgi:hypothetical protein
LLPGPDAFGEQASFGGESPNSLKVRYLQPLATMREVRPPSDDLTVKFH